MALGYVAALRHARLNLVRDYIDAGPGAGTVKIYTGVRPATGGALSGNTLLTTGTFADPSAPDASGGELVFSAITYTNAAADGDAAWARIEDSTGAFVADASVGVSGSGADFILNSVSMVTDGTVSHVSAKIITGNP